VWGPLSECSLCAKHIPFRSSLRITWSAIENRADSNRPLISSLSANGRKTTPSKTDRFPSRIWILWCFNSLFSPSITAEIVFWRESSLVLLCRMFHHLLILWTSRSFAKSGFSFCVRSFVTGIESWNIKVVPLFANLSMNSSVLSQKKKVLDSQGNFLTVEGCLKLKGTSLKRNRNRNIFGFYFIWFDFCGAEGGNREFRDFRGKKKKENKEKR
jgi:hypothetical protein